MPGERLRTDYLAALGAWYSLSRCPGAPESVGRLLAPRRRQALELWQEGLPRAARAPRLGMNPKTLSNQMSQERLVEAVQRAVRGLVFGLSRADRLRLAAHLIGDAGLTDDQVSRLLCAPRAALTDSCARPGRPARPGWSPPRRHAS